MTELMKDKDLDFNIESESAVDCTGKKLRVGIIGCGWIAEAHVKNYLTCPDAEIVAGSDIIPGKAAKFFEKMGVEGAAAYDSTEEMLEKENLDVVSICTYNSQHAPCAIQAMKAGVDVMLEKLFTVTLDFRIAWAMHLDTPGDTIIMGTKGSLRIPSTECWNGTVGGPMKIYHNVYGKPAGTEIPILQTKDKLFNLKIRFFLEACKTRTQAPVPSSQILFNQAILDGIVKSAELGREVEIEIPEI